VTGRCSNQPNELLRPIGKTAFFGLLGKNGHAPAVADTVVSYLCSPGEWPGRSVGPTQPIDATGTTPAHAAGAGAGSLGQGNTPALFTRPSSSPGVALDLGDECRGPTVGSEVEAKGVQAPLESIL
jgi:hypothetical protein